MPRIAATAALSLLLLTAGSILFAAPAGDDVPMLRLRNGGHFSTVKEVVFSRDGSTLFTAGDDKQVLLWDAQSGTLRRTIPLPAGTGVIGKIYAMDATCDGSLIVAGGVSVGPPHTADYLIDAGTGEILHTHREPALVHGANHLKFSPDGSHIAGSHDRTIIYRVTAGRTLETVHIGEPGSRAGGVAWFPDSARFALLDGQHNVRILDRRGALLGSFPTGQNDQNYGIAISPDGGVISTGCWDGTVRTFSPEGKRLGEARFDFKVWDVQFSPDGRRIAVATGFDADEYGVHILDAFTMTPVGSYLEHDMHVRSIAWNPAHPELLASAGGHSNEVHLVDAANLARRATLAGSGRAILALEAGKSSIAWGGRYAARLPNSRASIDEAFDFAAWDFTSLESESRAEPLENLAGMALECPDPEGRLIVARLGSQEKRLEFPLPYDWVTSYSFINERLFALGTGFGKVHVYSTRDGARVRDLIDSESMIYSMAPLDGGRLLATGSQDEIIRLWNPGTGELLVSLYVDASREWIAWTPRGFYHASPKGTGLIAWQFNGRADGTPEVFGADLFADLLHRPDIVSLAVSLGDLDAAIAKAGPGLHDGEAYAKNPLGQFSGILPPEVVLSPIAQSAPPPTNTPTATPTPTLTPVAPMIAVAGPALHSVRGNLLTLEFSVGRGPSGQELLGIGVTVNGAPVDVPLEPRFGAQRATITLQPGLNRVAVHAWNRTARSEARVVEVHSGN